MNNNSKRLKGFSLIELIIVLAVFMILVFGAFQLYGPVERIFKNASVSEKTYSYTNNIQVELKSRLEYADCVRIYDTASLNGGNVTKRALRDICDDIREDYYKDIVRASNNGGAVNVDYIDDAHIYIMHFLNNASGSIPAGQITVRAVDFSTNTSATIAEADIPDEDATTDVIINPAFFTARDAVYTFNYALGAGAMVNVAPPTNARTGETYRALNTDLENVNVKDRCDFRNLAISIITSKDLTSGGTEDMAAGAGHIYRSFVNPNALSVANIALTNISYRNNQPAERFYYDTTPGATVPYVRSRYSVLNGTMVHPYLNESSENVDFNNDIYIFYTLPQEFE